MAAERMVLTDYDKLCKIVNVINNTQNYFLFYLKNIPLPPSEADLERGMFLLQIELNCQKSYQGVANLVTTYRTSTTID